MSARAAGEMQITWMGSNFQHHFASKTEAPKAAHVLDVYMLLGSAADQTILDGIGGSLAASLNDVWALLSRRLRGEAGALRTDGITNVFYVRDNVGKMWAVDTVWGGAGWELGASGLNSAARRQGTHVLTR